MVRSPPSRATWTRMEVSALSRLAVPLRVLLGMFRLSVKEFEEVFEFVTDRKGHDRRYAIDTSRLRSQFPAVGGPGFDTALRQTVDYYLADRD